MNGKISDKYVLTITIQLVNPLSTVHCAFTTNI